YVPLDPSYPRERLAFMLEDSGVPLVLIQDKVRERLPALRARTICFESDAGLFEGEEETDLDGDGSADNLAYSIYTSGSTGRPKGVLVTHGNLVHSTTARRAIYREPLRSFLLLSSFSFDSSVAGLFWALCSGGTLILPEEGPHQDPAHILNLIASFEITHVLAIPSLYSLLLGDARAR